MLSKQSMPHVMILLYSSFIYISSASSDDNIVCLVNSFNNHCFAKLNQVAQKIVSHSLWINNQSHGLRNTHQTTE